jgi:hypothetical protein
LSFPLPSFPPPISPPLTAHLPSVAPPKLLLIFTLRGLTILCWCFYIYIRWIWVNAATGLNRAPMHSYLTIVEILLVDVMSVLNWIVQKLWLHHNQV